MFSSVEVVARADVCTSEIQYRSPLAVRLYVKPNTGSK